jgi:hypothetical protein
VKDLRQVTVFGSEYTAMLGGLTMFWSRCSLVGLLAAAALCYRLLFPGAAALPPSAAKHPAPSPKPQLRQGFARIPLSFEANKGQTDKEVDYLARGLGYILFLTPREAVLTLSPPQSGFRSGKNQGRRPTAAQSDAAVVRMQLLGGNPAARASGDDQLPGSVNYFRGNDLCKWRTSADFPIANPLQPTLKGSTNAFVTKIGP